VSSRGDILIRSPDSPDLNIPNMLILLKIAGGVALLLFGVRYLRKGLDRIFGAQLAHWMRRIGSNSIIAFFTGIITGILAPSSTTISLIAVQAVQTGAMTTRQTLAIMLGANIGLTILVQLVALRLDEYAPALILVGFVLFQYTNSGRSRGIGQIILALGFFFLAMSVIKGAVSAGNFNGQGDLSKIIQILEKYPLWLAIMAAFMATVLQSATATIGLVIGLGQIEGIDIRLAIPVVIGANVGLAITTLIVGWRQVDSKRLGVANLMLKLVVALAWIAAFPWLHTTAESLPGLLPAKIAMLHTGFNVAQALIGLPMIGPLTKMLDRLIPTPTGRSREFGPKFINDGPVDSLALATGQSLREILHMSEIVRSMLQDVWNALKNNDERLARAVSERDNQVDLLDREIKRYLTRVAREDSDQQDATEQIRQLQFLTELETVGDIIDKNLCELVLKKIRLRARFTGEGEGELNEFYRRVVENQVVADSVFATREPRLAQQLLRVKDDLNEYEQELRDRHFARLNRGLAQAHETSAIHLDLLTHLKRINSALSHVAYPFVANGVNRHHDATPPDPKPTKHTEAIDSPI
jgi:phosphate:Na+ symporter